MDKTLGNLMPLNKAPHQKLVLALSATSRRNTVIVYCALKDQQFNHYVRLITRKSYLKFGVELTGQNWFSGRAEEFIQ